MQPYWISVWFKCYGIRVNISSGNHTGESKSIYFVLFLKLFPLSNVFFLSFFPSYITFIYCSMIFSTTLPIRAPRSFLQCSALPVEIFPRTCSLEFPTIFIYLVRFFVVFSATLTLMRVEGHCHFCNVLGEHISYILITCV